jgi:hypothetical protein
MNLDVQKVEAAGDHANERIVLLVTGDANATNYAIFDCRRAANGNLLSGIVKNVFWFPPKLVKSGDFVVLYTKGGVTSEKVTEGGPTSHFFYWGSPTPLWVSGATPVLVETPMWKAVPVGSAPAE